MPRFFLLLTWGEAGEAGADGGHHLVSLPCVHAQLHVLIGTLYTVYMVIFQGRQNQFVPKKFRKKQNIFIIFKDIFTFTVVLKKLLLCFIILQILSDRLSGCSFVCQIVNIIVYLFVSVSTLKKKLCYYWKIFITMT